MKQTLGVVRAVAFVCGMAGASVAMATTGYFALGYGAKAMGMAGAVVSNPQDSIISASNPAGMALVGERFDVGIRFFNPVREAEISTMVPAGALGAGSEAITYNVHDDSRRNMHYIPNAGYTSRINDRLWWGISVYGNGGMNTTFDRNIYNEAASAIAAATGQVPPGTPFSPPEGFALPFPDTGTLGVDLAQVLFTPTIAMQVNDRHTVGASLIIGSQRFSARGLGNFQCFTLSAVTNNPVACGPGGAQALDPTFIPSTGLSGNHSDITVGAGVRLGWIGELSPSVTLGATVASKVYMKEFDDYDELFAEQGDFDLPANFSVGATFKATPKLSLSFDFQRILYEGVASISNAGPIFVPGVGPFPPSGPPPSATTEWLGTDNGMGFGWEDINIYRLGMEYMHDSKWTFRAGFALNDQPIGSEDVLFNILAPAVIEKHATFGFTFRPDKTSEWNFAYMRAFEETVSTSQSAFGFPASITMHQNSVDVSYSRKF